MRKTTLIIAAILATCLQLRAEVRDTIRTNIRAYNDEIGFFQKANRDLSDPRFMFLDSESGLEFGVGGTAIVNAHYGFRGEVPAVGFHASGINIPTYNLPHYLTTISRSELHAKARYQWGDGHKMIAFVKFGGRDDRTVAIKQAYVSIDGFSFGLIPSFFTDLEAGVLTTGDGPDCCIGNNHTLLGYTRRLGNDLTIAGALEYARLDVSQYSYKDVMPFFSDKTSYLIADNYQPLPDFAMHLKYRFATGHLQMGLLLRNLAYRSASNLEEYDQVDMNLTRYVFGYGLNLSGNWNPNSRLKLSFEAAGGRGISDYFDELGDKKVIVGLQKEKDDGYPILRPIQVAAATLSAQYTWHSGCTSSLVANYTHCFRDEDVVNYDNIRNAFSLTANYIWQLSDYAYAGVEYIFGKKSIYADGINNGVANRVCAVVAFCF